MILVGKVQVRKASEQAFIVSSHDLEFILEVCDRVLLLDEGQFIVDGDPKQMMSDSPLMEAHGLERPHSLAFHKNDHHSGSKTTP
ncbi:MAG: hypothetical protein KDJ52_18915 [Anaerolineae bacterium]|nr:hypothetical protein [Anaerolineae bacterium]